jgi:hypothetical protein
MKPLEQKIKIKFTFNKLIHIDLDYYICSNILDNFSDNFLWDGLFNDYIISESFNDNIAFN